MVGKKCNVKKGSGHAPAQGDPSEKKVRQSTLEEEDPAMEKRTRLGKKKKRGNELAHTKGGGDTLRITSIKYATGLYGMGEGEAAARSRGEERKIVLHKTVTFLKEGIKVRESAVRNGASPFVERKGSVFVADDQKELWTAWRKTESPRKRVLHTYQGVGRSLSKVGLVGERGRRL